MDIESLVAHLDPGRRRGDTEGAGRHAIRPREGKAEPLDVAHRSDVTTVNAKQNRQ